MNEKLRIVLKKAWNPPTLLVWLGLLGSVCLTVAVVSFVKTLPEALRPATIVIAVAVLLLCLWIFVRWLCSWPNLRRTLFVLACLITLVALFYAEEDFRGKHAWNNFKREGEAQGEKFDMASFVPPPVPDDQNFAMTPLLRPVLDYYRSTNGVRWRDTNGYARLENLRVYGSNADYNKAPAFGSVEQDKFTDLQAWHDYYQGNTNFPQPKLSGSPAQDILVALGKFDAEMNELREAAATRPASRFPIHYEEQPPFGILLPHLSRIKGLCQLFLLRSTALMELGRGEEALADLQMAFRFSDSVRDEPFLIDHLVRIAALTIDLEGVREGLVRHVWSDAQLARLEKYLASLNILAEAEKNMRGERSFGLSGLEYYRRKGFGGQPAEMYYMGEDGNSQNPPAFLGGLSLLPGGIYYQNMVVIALLHQEFILGAVDEPKHRVFPEISAGLTNALSHMRMTPYNLLGKMLMPAFAHSSRTSARAQTFVDEARAACALERYRLAHGQLPEALEAVAPQFIEQIPNDVIDGKLLRYRKNSDGSYVLYSIGWNQTDDGGIVVMGKGSVPGVEANQGDWVWQMPAK